MLMSEYEQAQKEVMEKESDTDIRLNLLIDATPDATMKIIMDPIAGDYISGKGTGNIRTEFYNKGDVKMFGSYRISQGVYKFSLQEVIRKDFIIKDGSTITFNGAPLNATLDIQAGYLVNSASLNDLVPDAGNYVNQTNIKVNCLMALTGQLTSPDIKMSLELPNERDEVQALVRNYIPTDEQMNMQIQEEYQKCVNAVVDYINLHLGEEIDLKSLARISHFSPFYFHRIMKAFLGEPVGTFIVRTRTEAAARLLRYSDMPIADIAYRIGYSSPSSLSKVFKQFYGISPLEYRNNKNFVIMKPAIIRPELELKHEIKEVPARNVIYIRLFGDYKLNDYCSAWMLPTELSGHE